MKTEYEMFLIHIGKGIKVIFTDECDLPDAFMKVFDNATFRKELKEFLMVQYMKPRHQASLKKMDYDNHWGK